MPNRWKAPHRYRVLAVPGALGEPVDTLTAAAARAARASRGRALPVRVERREVFEHGATGPWREVPYAEWLALVVVRP